MQCRGGDSEARRGDPDLMHGRARVPLPRLAKAAWIMGRISVFVGCLRFDHENG